MGSEHVLIDSHGFGTASASTIFETRGDGTKGKASYESDFIATIDGTGADVGEYAVLTGTISLEKLPSEDLTLSLDWNDIVNVQRNGWTSKNTPDDFITAGLTSNNTEVGTSTWGTAGTTGAELSITNVTLTIG